MHSYLSGAVLPSAAALDTIVLALGCTPTQARAWGRAWERVADASHGCLSSSGRGPHRSTFARLDDDTRTELSGSAPAVEDEIAPLAICERATIGPTRLLDRVHQQITLRARVDGADRWLVRFAEGRSVGDLRLLAVTDTRDCRPGARRFLPAVGVQVLEVLLDSELEAGEVRVIDFCVDYAASRAGGAPPTARRRSAGWPPEPSVGRGFRRRGPAYTLTASFPAADRPRELHQLYQPSLEAPHDQVRPLRLNRWGSVSIGLDQPAAGLHGIGWSW